MVRRCPKLQPKSLETRPLGDLKAAKTWPQLKVRKAISFDVRWQVMEPGRVEGFLQKGSRRFRLKDPWEFRDGEDGEVRRRGAKKSSETLAGVGMTCGGCSGAIERILKKARQMRGAFQKKSAGGWSCDASFAQCEVSQVCLVLGRLCVKSSTEEYLLRHRREGSARGIRRCQDQAAGDVGQDEEMG